MINRDEAKEKFTDFIRVPSMDARTKRIHQALDEIYDSIGTCGECKYLLEKGKCRLHSVDAEADVIMMNKDFCSYFERKES